MREIKFRAWDKFKKQMMYRNLFDRNWYATEYNDENGCHCIMGIKPEDRYWYPVMQNTGLKDKNGKEIYEGDIVKDKNGVGEVWWNPNSARFFFDSSKGLKITEPQYHLEVEIVGNIYENPELLEGV